MYPKKIEYYTDCAVHAKKLVLTVEEQKMPHCSGPGDAAVACLLGVLGASLTISIVSGSIVIIGNTIYWLEKEGKCVANKASEIVG
jgi:hypothetical protein